MKGPSLLALARFFRDAQSLALAGTFASVEFFGLIKCLLRAGNPVSNRSDLLGDSCERHCTIGVGALCRDAQSLALAGSLKRRRNAPIHNSTVAELRSSAPLPQSPAKQPPPSKRKLSLTVLHLRIAQNSRERRHYWALARFSRCSEPRARREA